MNLEYPNGYKRNFPVSLHPYRLLAAITISIRTICPINNDPFERRSNESSTKAFHTFPLKSDF